MLFGISTSNSASYWNILPLILNVDTEIKVSKNLSTENPFKRFIKFFAVVKILLHANHEN